VVTTETIAIDASSPTQPFPHFWETVFGSGRAILTLRESYRQDLRAVKDITDFEYIRFHAIFHDEVGIYDEDKKGRPVYNFSYIDQIYDGLLENSVRPFVELSFMPLKLASKRIAHRFSYKQIIAPPKSWSRWEELVFRFVKHLVDRYGIEEVVQWYFEVWNEPNIDFWAGKPKESTYYKLYDHAAHAIKRVSPHLRVGGPATAQAAWVDRFIKHCVENDVPVDFVSTHVYANDKATDVFGTKEIIPRNEMVARAAQKVYDQVKSSALPDLPIHWTEYNASYKNEVSVTDGPFMGPWLAETILKCDGLLTTLAYWTLSDVFEEQGIVKRPFYGGYGLIAAGHIPKASYNAFKLLHELGTERIKLETTSTIATRRNDGSLAIAVWNYTPPNRAGSHRRVRLVIKGPSSSNELRIHLVDRNNGSPLETWQRMGSPPFPTYEQQQQLRTVAELSLPEVHQIGDGETTTASLDLTPHSLALIEVKRQLG
jgi:xylan 1,4-beta-xylosidase